MSMASIGIDKLKRTIKRVAVIGAVSLSILLLLATLLWRDRLPLADVPLASAAIETFDQPAVTVTWFGVTTLLFDDGETQILIDGFISRPTLWDVLSDRPVDHDTAAINAFLNEYRIRRLAAIIPVHSHFDHAMDVGAIANRSSASILGSATTAHIAAGAGVPDDQIVTVSDGAEYKFGEFTVSFIETNHAPVGWRGSVPFPGVIDAPLQMPAPVSAFRHGGSYSIVIAHPLGATLVQGSAGVRESALDRLHVDVVMLGVGMLEGLGADYIENYWKSTVTATGAKTVYPVHFDDYTQPFGTVMLPPRLIDNLAHTASLLDELRRTWDADTRILLPRFGVPIKLYPHTVPEA